MGRNDVACEGFNSRTHSVVQLVTTELRCSFPFLKRMQHRDFLGGHSSQYYSSPKALNFRWDLV
jgi:hypothetical protein